MTINSRWETTFADALTRPGRPSYILLIIDLFASETYERAKTSIWDGKERVYSQAGDAVQSV